jgi:hypothetical protein
MFDAIKMTDVVVQFEGRGARESPNGRAIRP